MEIIFFITCLEKVKADKFLDWVQFVPFLHFHIAVMVTLDISVIALAILFP